MSAAHSADGTYEEREKNMKFSIVLAGQRFTIYPRFSYVKAYCEDYLVIGEHQGIQIRVSQADIDWERKKSASTDRAEGNPVRSFPDEYLETLAVYRKIADILLTCDTLLFHGSAVAVDQNGYLFTAKSGTGKSTHTGLWRKVFGNRAVMVNDDKPLLKVTPEGVMVYGSPWNGKHRISTNLAVPLQGIAVLTRGQSNQIELISSREAYPIIVQQTNRPGDQEKLEKTLLLIDRMLEQVPVYRLSCNMEPEAAKLAYERMKP